MKKRIIWLLVSFLMVAALVLASCAPAVTEEEEEEVVTEEEEEGVVTEEEEEEEVEMVKDSLGRMVEKPQYGGSWRFAIPSWLHYNPAQSTQPALALPTYEGLLLYDITKGPGGTKEMSFAATWHPDKYAVGNLAESWEQPDLSHFVFTIRKGVRWQNKAPVYGREVTADDVVYSFNYLRDYPLSHLYVPPGTQKENTYRVSIDPDDKWKVIVMFPKPSVSELRSIGTSVFIFPREVMEAGVADWRNMCGTGPFIAEDMVVGSYAVYKRNPDYWGYDPFHPQNRLPYVDSYRLLIIPDRETEFSAMRTGQLERLYSVTEEERLTLQNTTPYELMVAPEAAQAATLIYMMNIVKPFDDIRVRKAISLAIDQPGIADYLYGGEADILTWPLYVDHGSPPFTPLEELPDELQMLLEYHPGEAKKLLAEAGYPNGFDTNIIYTIRDTALIQIVQANLMEVGINMEMRLLESAPYWSTVMSHTTEQMAAYRWGSSMPFNFAKYVFNSTDGVPGVHNYCYIVDPYFMGEWGKVSTTLDEVERNKMLQELAIYSLDRCWLIQLPCPYTYTLWQPWVKKYHGVFNIGHLDDRYVNFVKYAWIDQDLKRQMGY